MVITIPNGNNYVAGGGAAFDARNTSHSRRFQPDDGINVDLLKKLEQGEGTGVVQVAPGALVDGPPRFQFQPDEEENLAMRSFRNVAGKVTKIGLRVAGGLLGAFGLFWYMAPLGFNTLSLIIVALGAFLILASGQIASEKNTGIFTTKKNITQTLDKLVGQDNMVASQDLVNRAPEVLNIFKTTPDTFFTNELYPEQKKTYLNKMAKISEAITILTASDPNVKNSELLKEIQAAVKHIYYVMLNTATEQQYSAHEKSPRAGINNEYKTSTPYSSANDSRHAQANAA